MKTEITYPAAIVEPAPKAQQPAQEKMASRLISPAMTMAILTAVSHVAEMNGKLDVKSALVRERFVNNASRSLAVLPLSQTQDLFSKLPRSVHVDGEARPLSVAALATNPTADSTGISATGCYSNCHSNCHGNRSWR